MDVPLRTLKGRAFGQMARELEGCESIRYPAQKASISNDITYSRKDSDKPGMREFKSLALLQGGSGPGTQQDQRLANSTTLDI